MSPLINPNIEISELWDSGRTTFGAVDHTELRYIITGTDNEAEVRDAVILTAPPYIGDNTARAIIVPENIEVNPLGNGIWEASVPYKGYEDETQYTFETGGATAHITQSLATVGVYPPVVIPLRPPPDFQGAIGVNGDNVAGVDVTIPAFNFTITKRFDAEDVTGAYKLALFYATGKTNNATFQGFAAGEVLFLGASGSRTGMKQWEITFKFAASPNAVNLPVGNFTVTEKKGHDYLWVRYADAVDGDAAALVKRPVSAYVERVYESADFASLGVGT